MAHFAELNEENEVTRVLVVKNEILLDENGDEQESLGIAFLQSLYGENTNWKQTSYNTRQNKHYSMVDVDGQDFQDKVESDDQNKKARGNFAGIGFTYDSENDVFIPPSEGEGYTLNTETWNWELDE
tara:strand:- start:1446 stop:1826 length:381 start_codon:yes stop_codon:yes gene_type:complete